MSKSRVVVEVCKGFGFLFFLVWIGVVTASAQIGFRPQELPSAIVGEPYYVPIQAYGGGSCPLTDIRLSSPSLPHGLELTNNALEGTLTRIGSFPLTIEVRNDCVHQFRRYTLVVTAKPILAVAPEALEFEVKLGETASLTKNVIVRADRSDLPFQIESDGSKWLQASVTSGVTPREGSALSGDPVHVTVDPSQLKPGTYRGSFKISASHSANQPVVPVTLIVEEK